ncbi:transposase [Micromonospora fluostatini]|uniref:Transposase n=1 Tax=Micromonospora fluostatini TaxID=1629071 RepID=A0ABY2DME9_9ACTN|nr:transposase [Micromonospora fluostatini]
MLQLLDRPEFADLAPAQVWARELDRERVNPDQLIVHADRGAAMTSKTVTQLLTDLRISRSHSRLKTSNDNPYIEASSKTLKYDPTFPDRFGSIQHARQHCEAFYTYYASA